MMTVIVTDRSSNASTTVRAAARPPAVSTALPQHRRRPPRPNGLGPPSLRVCGSCAAPESTCKPPVRKSGAPGGKSCGWRCRAAIWAQVTGQIWPPGPDGTSESLLRARCLARAPLTISPCPNRLASLLCAIAASQGQKLRLGGDALGAGPTYLLYLPSRSRGGLRRIDFGAWPRAAVSPRQIPPESTCKHACTSPLTHGPKVGGGEHARPPRRSRGRIWGRVADAGRRAGAQQRPPLRAASVAGRGSEPVPQARA